MGGHGKKIRLSGVEKAKMGRAGRGRAVGCKGYEMRTIEKKKTERGGRKEGTRVETT